jgi:signal transduction histidine kinase
LARVQAEVDWLTDRPRDAASLARSLAAISDATAGMGEMLETLMTAARSGASAAPGRSVPAEVVPGALQQAVERRPELDVLVDMPPDLVVGVDAPLLERLLGPLLDNAVRYARHRVTVTGQRLPDDVEIVVADDGPGLPHELAEKVFEAGWRADPADGHDGAGLGLALVRRLATAAKGTVTVRPVDAGTAFAVRLPAG